MRALHSSRFYEVTEDSATRVVRLRRTGAPFPATVDVRAEVDGLVSRFRRHHREYGVIIDMRDAPPRNDPEFEEAMRHLRFVVGQSFARIVVLMRTATGQMQATRLHRQEGAQYHVTLDPEEALELARGSTARE
jgi:hypothetical protein